MTSYWRFDERRAIESRNQLHSPFARTGFFFGVACVEPVRSRSDGESMRATITDSLELILYWRDEGESTLNFALASASEFTISGRIFWNSGLNYQGETTVNFQTMCYGFDLAQFGAELKRLSDEVSSSARFLNTGQDFEIRIAANQSSGRSPLISEIRYRHFRSLRDATCRSELILPVGLAEDVSGTTRAIGEFIQLLKVDCRSLHELPK